MLKVLINHSAFNKHLKDKMIGYEDTKEGSVFFFISKSHLAKDMAVFYLDYTYDNHLDPTQDEKTYHIQRSLSDDFANSIETKTVRDKITHYIYDVLGYYKKDLIKIHSPDFFQLHLQQFNLEISELVDDWLEDLLIADRTSLEKIENIKEKEDVIFVSVENDGSIALLKKDSTLLGKFSYKDQEKGVAHVIHINPSTAFVYDNGHLLKQEMVICLKRYLKKKVEFVEEVYPINYN